MVIFELGDYSEKSHLAILVGYTEVRWNLP
jgi:hypothetical protein